MGGGYNCTDYGRKVNSFENCEFGGLVNLVQQLGVNEAAGHAKNARAELYNQGIPWN